MSNTVPNLPEVKLGNVVFDPSILGQSRLTVNDDNGKPIGYVTFSMAGAGVGAPIITG